MKCLCSLRSFSRGMLSGPKCAADSHRAVLRAGQQLIMIHSVFSCGLPHTCLQLQIIKFCIDTLHMPILHKCPLSEGDFYRFGTNMLPAKKKQAPCILYSTCCMEWRIHGAWYV